MRSPLGAGTPASKHVDCPVRIPGQEPRTGPRQPREKRPQRHEQLQGNERSENRQVTARCSIFRLCVVSGPVIWQAGKPRPHPLATVSTTRKLPAVPASGFHNEGRKSVLMHQCTTLFRVGSMPQTESFGTFWKILMQRYLRFLYGADAWPAETTTSSRSHDADEKEKRAERVSAVNAKAKQLLAFTTCVRAHARLLPRKHVEQGFGASAAWAT